MENFQSWMRQNKFEAHLVAFIMMVVSSVGMYFAAQQGAEGWIWGLLTVVILANLLAVLVQ